METIEKVILDSLDWYTKNYIYVFFSLWVTAVCIWMIFLMVYIVVWIIRFIHKKYREHLFPKTIEFDLDKLMITGEEPNFRSVSSEVEAKNQRLEKWRADLKKRRELENQAGGDE